MRALYYGSTRFSLHLPGDASWRVSKNSAADYASTLFSDERMQLRSDIFLNLALPVYSAWARRYAYRHVVHFSSDLPVRWRAELESASKAYPFLLLDEVEGTYSPQDAIRNNLRQSSELSGPVAWFRVDDDDVLANDYLEKLASYVTHDHFGYAISFGLGVAALYQNGHHTDFRLMRQVLPSAGQAYIGAFDRESGEITGLQAGPHDRIDTLRPVILDSREPMYLQTYHGNQDKAVGKEDDYLARHGKHLQRPDRAMLLAKFPADLRDQI